MVTLSLARSGRVKWMIRESNFLTLAVCALFGFIAGFALFGGTSVVSSPASTAERTPTGEGQGNPESATDEARWRNASSKQRIQWLFEICKQKDKLARDHALSEVIDRLQPADFLAALGDLPAFANAMLEIDNGLRGPLVEAAIDRWLDVDEPGALGWLSAARAIVESGVMELPEMGFQDVQGMFEVLARRKPEWMFEEVHHLGKKTERDGAVWVLMSQMAQSRPEKARAWLQTFEGTTDAKMAKSGFVGGLADSDPVAAITIALDRTDESAQDDMVFGICMKTAENHPRLLGDVFAKLDERRRAVMTWLALRTLGKDSSVDPFAWIQEQIALNPSLRELRASQAAHDAASYLSGLVTRDPLRTIEWVRTFPDAQRPPYLEGALSAWSRRDPRAMLDWLAGQAPDALPENIPGLGACATEDPQRFAQWARGLPAGELRDRSEVALATEYAADGHIAEALRSFPANSTSEVVLQGAQQLIQTVAERDPAAAANWIASMADGPLRIRAAKTLVAKWAQQSIENTAAWVERLPAGTLRDSAIGSLAGAVAQTDPASATLWFAQVTYPNARNAAASAVYHAWNSQDPTTARNWLQTVGGIDESVRARLLRNWR